MKQSEILYTTHEKHGDDVEIKISDIRPIVNELNYIADDDSKLSVFTSQEMNSEIWLTNIE